MRIKHVLAKKCRFDMQFQCIEAIFTPNDDVFVFIMPLHGCSFLPHQIVVDILVVSKPKSDVRKAKKDSSNANKKRRQDNNTERRTRKVVVRPVRGHKRRPNCVITVKFVLKLFQTYITSDYSLYLCNGITAIAIPEAND